MVPLAVVNLDGEGEKAGGGCGLLSEDNCGGACHS
jgi:hypothetical protein